jgi:tRNA-dihydrouridine synthase B
VPGGAKLRAAIYQAKTGVDVLARVDEFFAAQIERVASGADPALQPDDAEEQIFPDGALVCD